jgi:spore coat protein H
MLSAADASAQIPRFTVDISRSDSASLFSRDQFSNEFLPARITYGQTTWDSAAIRFKGRSNRYFAKKSYRLKFPAKQHFHGAHQINLHSMYTDKSFLREKLAWDLFADMNELAPGASYAGLTLNNTPQGLFLAVDRVDKPFLKKHGRPISSLYNAGGYYSLGDFTVQPEGLLELYYPKEIGDTDDYDELKDLMAVINATPDSTFGDMLDSLFDMRSVYNWFAGNILMMAGDSYNKNYYLYHDTTEATYEWVIIPWDYDLSFGLSGDLAFAYPQSLLNDGFSCTFPPLAGPNNVLKDRLWKIPELREQLRLRVDTLLRTVFTEERMDRRIDSLAALIKDEVAMDPQKPGTLADFLDNVEALKYYVIGRRNYLLKTFVHPSSGGMFDMVTMPITGIDRPYNFVGPDGQQIATMSFTSVDGLDSILVEALADSIPPNLPQPDSGKYVKRWLRVTPYPDTASFTAKLQWMYDDNSLSTREVRKGVKDERALRCFSFNGKSWKALPSHVNPFSNIVTVDSVTEDECDGEKYFALFIP